MTISSTTRVAGPFIGTGTASTFPFTFKVFAAADLDVIRLTSSTGVETTLVLTSDYTVTLNGDQNSNPGGSITLVAGPLASGYTLTITSDIANLQPTDLTNQGGFYPEVITDALDRATIQIQQMADDVSRSIKAPISDSNPAMELPAASVRANSFLAFDASGNPTVYAAGSSGTPTAITHQAFSGNGSQTVFTLATDPGGAGNSVQVFIGGVYQQRTTYTIVGTALTFTQAPVAGTNNIEVLNFLLGSTGSGVGIVTLTGDVSASGTGTVTATITPGAVTIPKISAIGSPSSSTFLRGDGAWQAPQTVSDGDKGDITVSGGGGTWTIDNGVVTPAKIGATGSPSASTFLRGDGVWSTPVATVADGDKGDITVSASGATWTIDNSVVTVAKLSATGTPSASTFLRGDGAWQAPTATIADGDKGDITVSSSGTVWTIDNDVVTYAKMQNVSATDRLLGRDASGAGDVEELTVGGGIEFTGTGGIQTSAFTGDVTKSAGGTSTTIANDAVTFAKMQNISTDRLLGRDAAGTGDTEELTVGGGIEFTTTGGIQTTAFTGDVTKSAGGTSLTIANDAVTYAKMQNVSATDRLLGRQSSGSGDVEEITCTAAGRALLDDADATAQRSTLGLGAVAQQGDGDKGDITVSASGATWTVDSQAITYAKIQNVTATDRLLGRSSAGAGTIEEITCTSAGRAILDDADATAQRSTLGLGALATKGDADYGDITVSASGATWTVDNGAITPAKLSTGAPSWDGSSNLTVTGDLTVSGNDIKSSTATAITMSGTDVSIAGDLTVTGNDIKSSSATAMSLSGADVSMQGNTSFKDYTEGVVAIGTVGASHTFVLTNGTVQTATLTSATACTFTMPTATAGKSFVLLIKQPASGSTTTATFTGVKWSGGTAPTITATLGRLDVISFFADGTNWYGSFVQNFTP